MKLKKPNKKPKKFRFNSIKFKVFVCTASFALVMLALLWLFQTVFLDDFYKDIKTHQIESISKDIAEVIEYDDFNESRMQDYIDDVTSDSDYCVSIYDETGAKIYQNADNKGTCGLLISAPDEISKLYSEALKSKDGSALIISDQNDYQEMRKYLQQENNNTNTTNGTLNIRPRNNEFKSMTYAKIIEDEDDNVYFVLVNAKITLVNEVVNTLRTQLLIVTAILIILAILIGLFVAKMISKPIEKTNEAAKELAKGNLQVEFKGKGYLEIEELNATLNYASSELAKVEQLRNELIANVSHDFRTPLTMIAGYSEMIRDLPNENTPENLQVIIDECNRLTRLVNELLDLSKLQTNNAEMHMLPLSITDLTKSVVKRFNTMMKNEGYQVIFNYDEDIIAKADEIRLNQVIYNIIGNAIHYTGSDKLVIVNQIRKGDKVRIEIIDHGKGIKPEELPYVWDRYYKSNKVTKRQEVGTGIGLSICRNILEMHKATYGIESEVGKGSNFYFELDILTDA